MNTILAKLYDSADVLVGELPNFLDVQIQDQLNEANGWTLKYDRNGINAQHLIQDQDMAIRFFVEGVGIFEGLLEEDNWDEVSDSTPLTLAGRSQAGMFEYAKVYPKLGVGETAAAYPFVDATPGKIFKTLFDLAQGRGCLPGFTITFTDTHDSNGVLWSNDLNITYNAGTGLLDILTNFGDAGYADWRMTGKRLDMYNPRTVLGGQSGAIFRRGRDIESAPRSRSRRDLGTVYLVQGEDDLTVERVDDSAVAARGRREQYLNQGGISDAGTLNVIGDLQLLVHSDNRLSKTHRLSFSNDQNVYNAQPKPWMDYIPGEYVDTDLTGELENYRLVALNISMGTSGFVAGEVTLNDVFQEREILLDDRISMLSGGSAGGGASTTPTSPSEDKTTPEKVLGVDQASEVYVIREGAHFAQTTVTWAAVTTNTDGSVINDLDHYELQWWYNSAPAQYRSLDVTDEVAVFSNLLPGEQITVQVRAWDRNAHAGAWSDQLSYTLADDTTPPPVPSTPVAANYLGLLRVEWDGLGSAGEQMPFDFEHVEVWYSTVTNFTPGDVGSVLADYLPAKSAAQISGLAYGTEYFTKLVAVDQKGNKSVASVQASAIPEQVVRTDIGGAVIDFSHIRFREIGNLIADGSFELDTTAALYESFGVSTLAVIDNPDGVTAVPSPKVLQAGELAGATLTMSSESSASPEESFVFIVSHKCVGLSGTDVVRLQLNSKKRDGTNFNTWFKVFDSTTNATEWTLREALNPGSDGGIQPDVVAIVAELYINITTPGAYVLIDQIELRKRQGTVLIEDAAINNAKIANLAVNDAKIANLSVGKLITGTLQADVTVSSRIKTADTGARAELNSAGFELWNSSGVRTVHFDGTDGSASIIGSLSSGASGNRLVVNPVGSGIPEIRMYPTTGAEYAGVKSYNSGDLAGADPSMLIQSGEINGKRSAAVVAGDRAFIGRYTVDANGFYNQAGGNIFMQDEFVELGVIGDSGSEDVQFMLHGSDGAIRALGEMAAIGDPQSAWNTGSIGVGGGPFTGWSVTYGYSHTGTPRVIPGVHDADASGSKVRAQMLTGWSGSGFTVSFNGSSTSGFTAYWWAWRIN